jgi:hypothetical protein
MTTVLHIALYRLRVFAPPADRPAPNALAGRTASSWRRSSRARSGRSYFTRPVTWGSKAWYRSAGTAPIRLVGPNTG